MHSRKNGWRGLIATLDTGTEDNWICEKVVDRLNLSVKRGLPVVYSTFDGRKISSGATVKPTWAIQGQNTSIVTEFRVAPKDAPFDVLFGRNLLSSGEVDFDSEDSPIQVLVPRKIKVSRMTPLSSQLGFRLTYAVSERGAAGYGPK
jgi:hypothetical protein